MANLDGVAPALRERIEWIIRASGAKRRGSPFYVSYGFRTLSEQRDLWNAYQAYLKAKREHPNTWEKYAAWAATAAYPGTSMHGKTDAQGHPCALAVDLACDEVDNPLRVSLGRQASLITPIEGEPWHFQLATVLEPLSTIVTPPTKEDVMTVAIQPIGSASMQGNVEGGWIVGAQGHVYAFGGAHHYGGWDDATRHGDRRCVALVPTFTDNGYWLVSNQGEVYAFGDAPFTGNYQSVWGPGHIIGAYRNNHIPGPGGVTLVRDDGVNLNEYALPA